MEIGTKYAQRNTLGGNRYHQVLKGVQFTKKEYSNSLKKYGWSHYFHCKYSTYEMVKEYIPIEVLETHK